MAVQLSSPSDAAEWEEARRLVLEYIASLGIDLSFQDIGSELNNMAEKFAGNGGGFFLAKSEGEAIGCVGFWRIDDITCELKRLYVSPAGRGNNIGEQLVRAVLESARQKKYKYMLLDTLGHMKTAIRLYEKLGFVEVDAYRHNPIEGARYFRLNLLPD